MENQIASSSHHSVRGEEAAAAVHEGAAQEATKHIQEQGPFSACHPIAMTQFPCGISRPRAFSFLSPLSPFPSLPSSIGI